MSNAEQRLAMDVANYAAKQEETVRRLEQQLAEMTEQRDTALEAAWHIAEKLSAAKAKAGVADAAPQDH